MTTGPAPAPFVPKAHTKLPNLMVPEDPESKFPFKESVDFAEAQSNLNWALDNLAKRVHLTFANAENVKFRMAECFGFMQQDIQRRALKQVRYGSRLK